MAAQVISEFLFSLLPTDTQTRSLDTEPMLQAVSALIDIFSDETSPYDVNFRHGRYLERLVNSVEGIRKATKAVDKRREGMELKRRGEHLRENLVDFIRYRRNFKF